MSTITLQNDTGLTLATIAAEVDDYSNDLVFGDYSGHMTILIDGVEFGSLQFELVDGVPRITLGQYAAAMDQWEPANPLSAASGAAEAVAGVSGGAVVDLGEDVRECDHCGDEVATLSSADLCDACEALEECPTCGERVEPGEMNHWPNLAKPVSMCDSCEHDARRGGWVAGA